MKHYDDDSLMLHTDLYQINMLKTYWQDGVHKQKVVADLFFRKMPFKNGFAVFAGLERMVDYLKHIHFSDSDLAYLRDLPVEYGYNEEFLQYLKTIKFTGTFRCMKEGELVFANEPFAQVYTTKEEFALIETALLNIANYQILLATKAARIVHVVGKDAAMEFGTRRAQELDAAIWGTRAAYIAGFSSTSNVRAGKLFGIPVSGTHAHALVQAYEDEYVAFKKYAESHKNCVFLVDTYDTLKSGIPNAIKVAKEMGDKINFMGIRLDSGDLAYLSKEARKMLDQAGFPNAQIVASNDLDEYTIQQLQAQGAKIDKWGIGTKLITAFDQPALGAVYKLVAVENEKGEFEDRIKISANPEKIITPGRKKVYRIINRENGKSEGDYITLWDENPNLEKRIKMFHPVHTYNHKFVTNFEAKELLVDVIVEGQQVYELPTLQEIRAYHQENLLYLWDEYKRTVNPEEYPVDLSQACWENKMNQIEKVRKKVAQQQKEAQ